MRETAYGIRPVAGLPRRRDMTSTGSDDPARKPPFPSRSN
jgi:hypothetical protein